MHEIIELVWGYIRGGWRYRWFIYLVAWPICLGGWWFVHKMPDQYEAAARVQVDTSSALTPLLRGLAVTSSADEGLQMMTRTLMNRPNLEKIARMTDMDLEAKTPEQMDALVSRLSQTIDFRSQSDANLYSISYVDNDPQLAKNVVQAMLTVFVESTLGDNRKDSDAARKFLDTQIKEYEDRLAEAENKLKDFKRKNAGLMPGEGGTYFQQLNAVRSQLDGAALELKEAENLRDELKRQLAGEEPTFGLMPSESTGSGTPVFVGHPYDVRISALEGRLDELRFRYTEKHPDVESTKATLEALRKKREEDLKAAEANKPKIPRSTSGGLNQNPVYQQLKISLSQAEARVQSLQPRMKAYKKDVVKLEGLIDTIPQIEADLASLNRDYQVNRTNYETLLARRESAKMAEQAENSSSGINFRIIDPPRVPFDPIGPNRPLFESVVLVAALVAGLVFALLMAEIKPTFDTPRKLQKKTQQVVLGSISRAWTSRERRNRIINIASFAVVGVLLLSAYALVLLFEASGSDFIRNLEM